MNKFEMEQYTQIRELIADLQTCFVDFDGECYTRTPSAFEWRRASRIVHRLNLICLELYGYANACRQYDVVDIRQKLHFVSDETQEKIPADEQGEMAVLDFVEFTQKEILQMPKHFQRLIIVNKKRCRLRTRASGENSTTYQIRYRRDGYDVTACGKTIELAKANFLNKIKKAKPKPKIKDGEIPETFHAFAMHYFTTKRIRLVVEDTYKKDLSRYNLHLKPFFKETPIAKITLSQCQRLIDDVTNEKKFKTADELYSLMNSIFKFAIDNHLIVHNPCSAVIREAYEKETSLALTKDEERVLLEKSHVEPLFELAFALALYTGLRPNELKTARIDGEFIIAVNSKRKRKGKTTERVVEFKRIYICNRLRAYLANGLPALPSPQLLRRRIKNALPNHILKDLRKTFNSRCKELGVSEHARKHFMGHSLGKLDETYTEFSTEYLLLEGKKLNGW